MSFQMEPLQPNPKYVPPKEQKEPVKKKKVVRRKKASTTATAKKSATATVSARTPRPLPASSAQPRDRLGRFASNAGSLIWGATKGTARVVVGTGKKVHKGIQTHQKQQKRRQNLEMRERNVAVTQQEIQLGMRSPKKKKKVVRRKRS